MVSMRKHPAVLMLLQQLVVVVLMASRVRCGSLRGSGFGEAEVALLDGVFGDAPAAHGGRRATGGSSATTRATQQQLQQLQQQQQQPNDGPVFIPLCECEATAGPPAGLGCEKEGWFISNFENQGTWMAGGGLVPLSRAICCRPCTPTELPAGAEAGGSGELVPKPVAVVSSGCHASSGRGPSGLSCEASGASFVTGFSSAERVMSYYLDVFYPVGQVECCTPTVLLDTGDLFEVRRCNCTQSATKDCGGLDSHKLLWGVGEQRQNRGGESLPIAPLECCSLCLGEKRLDPSTCLDLKRCNGHGLCELGACRCYEGWGASDCSVAMRGGADWSVPWWAIVVLVPTMLILLMFLLALRETIDRVVRDIDGGSRAAAAAAAAAARAGRSARAGGRQVGDSAGVPLLLDDDEGSAGSTDTDDEAASDEGGDGCEDGPGGDPEGGGMTGEGGNGGSIVGERGPEGGPGEGHGGGPDGGQRVGLGGGPGAGGVGGGGGGNSGGGASTSAGEGDGGVGNGTGNGGSGGNRDDGGGGGADPTSAAVGAVAAARAPGTSGTGGGGTRGATARPAATTTPESGDGGGGNGGGEPAGVGDSPRSVTARATAAARAARGPAAAAGASGARGVEESGEMGEGGGGAPAAATARLARGPAAAVGASGARGEVEGGEMEGGGGGALSAAAVPRAAPRPHEAAPMPARAEGAAGLSDREEAQHRALWPAFLAAKAAGKWAQFHRARLVVDGERAVADAAGAPVVTPAEVRAAATHSKPGTAPGPDGIPVDVWRKLGEPAFVLLAAVFTAVGAAGETPPGFLDGVVASIYKAKDAADAANYRPLTMLGSDYRILAKVLATRWTPLLAAVVGPEQTAFLAGRRISDNICLTQMLPGLLAANAAEGVGPTGAALALLDFRKAYDTIDRGCLLAVMEAVGVGDGVLAWTRTILTHTYASAEVNGFISEPRRYAAGVRQGRPAAPALFLFLGHALACFLRTCPAVCAGLRTLEAAVPGLWRLPLLSACKEPIWRLWLREAEFNEEEMDRLKNEWLLAPSRIEHMADRPTRQGTCRLMPYVSEVSCKLKRYYPRIYKRLTRGNGGNGGGAPAVTEVEVVDLTGNDPEVIDIEQFEQLVLDVVFLREVKPEPGMLVSMPTLVPVKREEGEAQAAAGPQAATGSAGPSDADEGSSRRDKRARSSAAAVCVGALPDVQQAAQAAPNGSALCALPARVLQRVFGYLQAVKEESEEEKEEEAEGEEEHAGGSAVRATCRALRDAYDACTTRLVLGGKRKVSVWCDPPPTVSWPPQLLSRFPSVTSVTVGWRCGFESPTLRLRDVLDQLPAQQLTHVCIAGDICAASTLAPLGVCCALERLDINRHGTNDLAPLAQCSMLQGLDVSGSTVKNLAVLAQSSPPLKKLDLSYANLSSANLPSTVSSNDLSSNLSSDLYSDLYSSDEPSNELCSSDLSSSESSDADLSATALSATTLSMLTPMHMTLTHLSVYGTTVNDLASLGPFLALQSLDIASTKVTSLGPLAACVGLQRLDIAHTPVAALEPVAACVALQHLRMAFTKITSLDPLAACVALRYLNIASTKVASLEPLSGCAALQHLDLTDTRVVDLAPLAACLALQHLRFASTKVASLEHADM
ncbi:hypothetical protein FOA52_010333 [Chlamydomonas sp. UWO 241]|nr:hypothetical protein FOA52_010333 [Chlamydomonas sp. UWO 241]